MQPTRRCTRRPLARQPGRPSVCALHGQARAATRHGAGAGGNTGRVISARNVSSVCSKVCPPCSWASCRQVESCVEYEVVQGQRSATMRKNVRVTLICATAVLVALGLLLFVALRGKLKSSSGEGHSSYCHSQCARCGCSRRVKIQSGSRVQDDIEENDLANWLSDFRTGACPHVWIPVSGWGSHNNSAWSGASRFNTCLEKIRELSPNVEENVTRELLARYDRIVEMADGQEKGQELLELIEELKSRIHQIDNK